MKDKYYIQNEKGLFLTKDNDFVFVFPEENIKTFSRKMLAKEEIQMYPKENLIIRKFLKGRIDDSIE